MATLDYAFLADFAKVEPNGTLTSVGASFTYVKAQQLPARHQLAVAGRVRAHIDESDIPLRIRATGPDETFTMGTDGLLTSGPNLMPYGSGWVGHLFALNIELPLPALGLYTVTVQVGDGEPRRLAFDVVTA